MSETNVNILILGAGWTSQFLVPLLEGEGLSYALTTRSGNVIKLCEGKYNSSKIISFRFQPGTELAAPDAMSAPVLTAEQDEAQYARLPTADSVIITFPLKGQGQSKKLLDMYSKTHKGPTFTNWIQLGSTGIYKTPSPFEVQTHESDYDTTSERAIAEDELISMGGMVLNLAGLWGAERVPWNWIPKIASTKEKLKDKKSLHLIHGEDVARACIACHKRFYSGDRFIVTDMLVYDWWHLIYAWAEVLPQEQGVDYRAWIKDLAGDAGLGNAKIQLPRSTEVLGRALDSSYFWEKMGIRPKHALSRKAKDVTEYNAKLS